MKVRFHKITAWLIIVAMITTTSFAFAETNDAATAIPPAGAEEPSSVTETVPAVSEDTSSEPKIVFDDAAELLQENDPGVAEEKPETSIEVQTPQGFTATNSGKGILLSWLQVPEAEGYYVSRRPYTANNTANNWSKIATITAADRMIYEDVTAASGTKYQYAIQAYCGEFISDYSPYQSIIRVPFTTIKSWKRLSSTSMVMTWNRAVVSGYQIQYSQDRKFNTYSSFEVANPSTVTKQINGLKANTKYYLRIRTYIADGTVKHYSEWMDYSTVINLRC